MARGKPSPTPENPDKDGTDDESVSQQRSEAMDMTVDSSAAAEPYSGTDVSLNDMFDLLAQEVERLQASLEFYRLSDHPEKNDLIRWHVRQIDARQDRLDEVKALLLEHGDDKLH